MQIIRQRPRRINPAGGGYDVLRGTVTLNDQPKVARVIIYDARTCQPVVITVSDQEGRYAAFGLSRGAIYMAVARDDTHQYNAVIQDMVST